MLKSFEDWTEEEILRHAGQLNFHPPLGTQGGNIAWMLQEAIVISSRQVDEAKRKAVVDKGVLLFGEISQTMQVKALELVKGICIAPGMNSGVENNTRQRLEDVLAGDPKYISFLHTEEVKAEDIQHGVAVTLHLFIVKAHVIGALNPLTGEKLELAVPPMLRWFISCEYWQKKSPAAKKLSYAATLDVTPRPPQFS